MNTSHIPGVDIGACSVHSMLVLNSSETKEITGIIDHNLKPANNTRQYVSSVYASEHFCANHLYAIKKSEPIKTKSCSSIGYYNRKPGLSAGNDIVKMKKVICNEAFKVLFVENPDNFPPTYFIHPRITCKIFIHAD